MSVIADLRSLDTAAATLEAHASDLRTRVGQLGAGVAATSWASPSARSFRQRADELRVELQQCAGQLDHAASELRRHAATARSRMAALADVADYAADALHLVGL